MNKIKLKKLKITLSNIRKGRRTSLSQDVSI